VGTAVNRFLVPAILMIGLTAAGWACATAPAAPVTTEQLVKARCADCHGPDGNSLKPTIPRLAGQHADYLYKQLRNFKAADGKPAGPDNPLYPTPADLVYVVAPEGLLPERMNPVWFLAMNGMVVGLTDNDMKRLATYFSAQVLKPEPVPITPEARHVAERLYQQGDGRRALPACAGCHGPDAAGLPAQFPRLAGQRPDYTRTQLRNFRRGDRTNDPNRMMRDIAATLTDEEIDLLADYVGSLRLPATVAAR